MKEPNKKGVASRLASAKGRNPCDLNSLKLVRSPTDKVRGASKAPLLAYRPGRVVRWRRNSSFGAWAAESDEYEDEPSIRNLIERFRTEGFAAPTGSPVRNGWG